MYEEDKFGITRDPNPEFSRLESLFEQELWSSAEAVMVLSGIDPESSGECSDSIGVSYHYISLPGTKEKYGVAKLNNFDFHMNVESRFDYLRGFISGESQTPHYWLEKALGKPYSPPWYEASKDAGHFSNLKTAAEKTRSERVGGGRSTQRNSPPGQFKLVVLVCWDAEIVPYIKEDKKQFKTRVSKFTAKYSKIYLNQRFEGGGRTIGDWVTHLKKDLLDENTASWITEYRNDPNYNEVSSQKDFKGKIQSASRSVDYF